MPYTIQRGDTLGRLANTWGTTVNDIMKANPYITDANRITAGKTLVNPVSQASAPKTATTAAPTTTTATPDAPANPVSNFQPTQFPYEQMLQQLAENRPQFSMDPEQMQTQASQFANLQIDPQISMLQQAKEDRTRQDMSNAVSRGVARGGAYDERISNTRKQFDPKFQDLEARRGDLTAQHLAGLQAQQHGRGVEDWNMQQQAAQMLAGMAQQHGQTEWGRSLDLHDRTMLTPLQQLQMHLGYTDALGETPPWMIDQFGGRQEESGSTSGGSSSGGTYTIKSGDTLGTLARQWGTTVDAIAKLNNISNPNLIRAGATLKRP